MRIRPPLIYRLSHEGSKTAGWRPHVFLRFENTALRTEREDYETTRQYFGIDSNVSRRSNLMKSPRKAFNGHREFSTNTLQRFLARKKNCGAKNCARPI